VLHSTRIYEVHEAEAAMQAVERFAKARKTVEKNADRHKAAVKSYNVCRCTDRTYRSHEISDTTWAH
jgi:hypothetical protein